MGDHRHFNLIREPWVRAQMADGSNQELSLAELFERGSEVRRLAGELPTQDYAVLRVLLAMLHRAVGGTRRGTEHVTKWWGRLNDDRWGTLSLVLAYLAEHEDRFWLFHDTAPFLQVAGLRTPSGKLDGVERLLADVPAGNQAQYFSMRSGRGMHSVDLAEAARWLVHVHAFDPSGIKSGAVGDPRIKGGKGYPIGTGWAGSTGGTYVQGGSLAETLMLNLVLDPELCSTADQDVAVWERSPLGPGVEDRADRFPLGSADLYTWPSRRVLLHREGNRVHSIQVSNGDPLDLKNPFHDPLSAYRYSPNQSKNGLIVYMPRAHDPARLLWRGIAPLLAETETYRDKDGHATYVRPAVVDWISMLADYDYLGTDVRISLGVVGAEYGSNNSTFADVFHDSVTVHAGLLRKGPSGARLADMAKNAADHSADAVQALGYLGQDLMRAAGNRESSGADRLRQAGYQAVDGPYRRWVSALSGAEQPEAALQSWHRTAVALLDGLARAAVEQSGMAAMTGRMVEGHFVSAPTAYARFKNKLAELLPVEAEDGGSNGKQQ